ncbi:AAA family ATPase [Lacinutrix jangbogonensis]|uniref:AAA family ATPase n=1 Tax=Lacinutrix jangbogonensis TaxID=1469557 RepID=UPI00053D2C4B|nr:AAA family ATPase [Lacinutrix jangbogonensis]
MNSKNINLIGNDLLSNENKLKQKESVQGCLIIKEANEWVDEAKRRPIPNMLFSELWYENELAILFADTNIGKSILAVQIADSLSRGKPIAGFKLECQPKKVLYLDFELSDKQFENRCSNNYKEHYVFNHNFLRAEINTDLDIPKEYSGIEDYLCKTLNESISKNNVDVLIIDNLTYLKSDNERAKDALELMKQLKKLAKTSGVSILVLAHTPKRDETKAISKNDLAGSKMLMNFCDSSFAIGASSQDSSLRYIKQIKQRNTEHLYHGDNVVLCQINKEQNFLKFEFLGFGNELEHLKTFGTNSKEESNNQLLELVEKGISNVQIGKELGIHEATVRQRRTKLGI